MKMIFLLFKLFKSYAIQKKQIYRLYYSYLYLKWFIYLNF